MIKIKNIYYFKKYTFFDKRSFFMSFLSSKKRPKIPVFEVLCKEAFLFFLIVFIFIGISILNKSFY